ncbi:MAG: leucine-rich repeat domain-containing protein [Oscillospiraceae bacterium]|nr:leucine-rich repeat domain-containing protein [Oscillospiraceae bacterium]
MKKRILAMFMAAVMVFTVIPATLIVSAAEDYEINLSWKNIDDEMLAAMVADGTIPADVESLLLNWNDITDLSPLAALTNLKFLVLENNEIADLSPLAGLTALEELDLYGNPVTDLSPLSGLSKLDDLDISGTLVSDLSPLYGLKKLTWLWATSTPNLTLEEIQAFHKSTTQRTYVFVDDEDVCTICGVKGCDWDCWTYQCEFCGDPECNWECLTECPECGEPDCRLDCIEYECPICGELDCWFDCLPDNACRECLEVKNITDLCPGCKYCIECDAEIDVKHCPTCRVCEFCAEEDFCGTCNKCDDCCTCVDKPEPPKCTGNSATCKVPNCKECDKTEPAKCTGNSATCKVPNCKECVKTEPPVPTVGCTEKDPCNSCEICGFHGGRYGFGRVTNGTSANPAMADALAILRFLVKLSSPIDSDPNALAAACITNPGAQAPAMADALQVLRFLVKLSAPKLNDVYGRLSTKPRTFKVTAPEGWEVSSDATAWSATWVEGIKMGEIGAALIMSESYRNNYVLQNASDYDQLFEEFLEDFEDGLAIPITSKKRITYLGRPTLLIELDNGQGGEGVVYAIATPTMIFAIALIGTPAAKEDLNSIIYSFSIV